MDRHRNHRGAIRRAVSGIVLVAIILGISLGLCGCSGGALDSRDGGPSSASSASPTITDMAGRKVAIPKSINKVFSTSPIGTIAIYALAPGKLAGWNTALAPEEKKYILPECQNLPVMGGWFGKNNTANLEEILKVRPDVILSMGTIDSAAISSADRIQKQLGIPVVLVDGTLTKLDQDIQFLGKLLGEERQAEKLAAYCRQTLDAIAGKVASIPQSRRIRVYYAEGPKGLQTDPQGSPHTEVLELAGGMNVAQCQLNPGAGMTDVSMEQVVSWNPQVIIAGDPQFYSSIFNHPQWKRLEAVKKRQVYLVPHHPFNWFDRPPSVNRILGLWWVADLLYPELGIDLTAKAKEFYDLFYHYSLNDDELKTLLQPQLASPGPAGSER